MQILLSCAKTMAATSDLIFPSPSEPPFAAEALATASRLASLSTDDLARLLRVNRTLAAENRLRYLHFHTAPQLPAIAAYTGIVFKHLAPSGFTADDFAYAQHHLNITSFLYGLLRPLDAIRNYRLEGDVVLPGGDDRTPFDLWPDRLTDLLIDRVRSDDGILVNLASNEMKRLFDWGRIRRSVRIITPEFRISEGDRVRTIVVYTKMCRGEMARHLLCDRVSTPEELQGFEWEGFRFAPSLSRGDNWTFLLR